jgi:hypothetical protein
MRSQKALFTATAIIEAAAGLPLLLIPALVIWLLLGVKEPSPEALVVSRVGGAGLLAIAVACWLGRDDLGSSSQRGLLWGSLVYNVGAAAVLAFSGSMLRMTGLALWPVVGLHAVVTIWCMLTLRASRANTQSIRSEN